MLEASPSHLKTGPAIGANCPASASTRVHPKPAGGTQSAEVVPPAGVCALRKQYAGSLLTARELAKQEQFCGTTIGAGGAEVGGELGGLAGGGLLTAGGGLMITDGGAAAGPGICSSLRSANAGPARTRPSTRKMAFACMSIGTLWRGSIGAIHLSGCARGTAVLMRYNYADGARPIFADPKR